MHFILIEVSRKLISDLLRHGTDVKEEVEYTVESELVFRDVIAGSVEDRLCRVKVADRRRLEYLSVIACYGKE